MLRFGPLRAERGMLSDLVSFLRDLVGTGDGAVPRGRFERVVAQTALSGLGATTALMGGAIWLYPGGTWAETSNVGHTFWGNFWCDLLRAQALNGAPNPWASQLALAAMVTFAVALMAFWVVVGRLLAPRRWAAFIVLLGWLGSAGVVVVGLTPTDRFPTVHSVAVVAAGSAFVAAVLGAIVGLWRRGGGLRRATLLAALGIPFAVLNLTQYAQQVYAAASYASWLPGMQKVATLCLALWMGAVSALALQEQPP